MKRRFFFQFLAILVCLSVLCACSANESSVHFSSSVSGGKERLSALNTVARLGLLEGSSATAWFSFGSLKKHTLKNAVAIEVTVENVSAEPVSLSLGLVTEDDVTRFGALVANPASRSLSTVENATGLTHIRMSINESDSTKKIVGFALLLTGNEKSQVRITHASIEKAETGWQNSPQFFWAGFGSEGGSINRANFSSGHRENEKAIIPSTSLLTLFFDTNSESYADIGTIAQQKRTVFTSDGFTFGFRKVPTPYITTVPSLLFSHTPVTVLVASGGENLCGMRIVKQKKFPIADDENRFEPISADPHMVIEWPQSEWRQSDREYFSWDRFPSIIIVDTADYATQDKLFKRLAFYVEKQGFKGKLWSDADLASLHAFNAHDYRAESLASFFEQARLESFALNSDELALRDLLLSRGIIQKDGQRYVGGSGAVLSISRASVSYLRYMFIAHEGYHGLYFIDADFRSKVSEVYNSMDKRSISFLESYFTIVDSLGYDITDTYLMENEFMAYLMQQPSDKVAPYFMGNITERFLRYGGTPSLAAYIADTQALDFVRAANELNEYVFTRWGLCGGRTGLYFPN